jgi:hypothetical protein
MRTNDNSQITSLSGDNFVQVRTTHPGFNPHKPVRLVQSFDNALAEYPTGSVLSLREIENPEIILYGQAYYIETPEFSMVRRIQRGSERGMIRAYSTSKDRYPDGQLVLEPMDIPKSAISRLSLVIGFVSRQNH